MNHETPRFFLPARRRNRWRPGARVPHWFRYRREVLAPCWQVVATEAASQRIPHDSLFMALAEHDLGSEIEESGDGNRPRVTHHQTDEGVRCCILSQRGDPVVRVALESECRAVLQEMQSSSASPLDKKPGRRYSESRIIVKPQRRKSGTPR